MALALSPCPDLLLDGERMYGLAAELFPLCRSITGPGTLQTLERLGRDFPLEIHEVPSGTEVFDWTIPREWSVREAYVADSAGRRVIDFSENNLHLWSYSMPFRGRVSRSELLARLVSLPEYPDRIPYRTTYYKETWGFCAAHRTVTELREDYYEVVIDSSLTHGCLRYGEYVIPGASEREVLISTHICHPSLANDNLSGIAVAAGLAQTLTHVDRRFTYRFLFVPGTIGSIAWLAKNEQTATRIQHGLVLTCVGDDAPLVYKRSRRETSSIDQAAELVLRERYSAPRILEFSPYGYDERQYCSPGFDLPVGCLMRSVHGEFPEYHTSADDLAFIKPDRLAETAAACLRIFDVIESNQTYLNTNPKCEPQLGKRGLYRSTGGQGLGDHNMAVLWILNLSDGAHTLLDIARRSRLPYATVATAARELEAAGLLKAPA